MPQDILDFMEKRLENFAQTQQALLLENRQAIQIDNNKFKSDMQDVVENQIKITVNGKIDKIAQHLQDQDITLGKLMVLLEDKKFLKQLWTLLKYIGGIIVSVSSAWLLFKQIYQ